MREDNIDTYINFLDHKLSWMQDDIENCKKKLDTLKDNKSNAAQELSQEIKYITYTYKNIMTDYKLLCETCNYNPDWQ